MISNLFAADILTVDHIVVAAAAAAEDGVDLSYSDSG